MEYYRLIVARYRERVRDGSYPRLVIDSIDLKEMLDLATQDRLPELTDYLLGEVRRLQGAGADFAALAANTPHLVFEPLRSRSPIPLLSIVEAACRAAQARSLRRLGLLGTRITMQGRFYADVFGPAGISLVLPSAEEQAYVHDKYMGELVSGVFRPETRDGLLAIVARLVAREGIQGVILGGTELPLILRQGDQAGIPFLDTTRLHVDEIVSEMLSP